ncbi:caspase family protein [bacterium]|nr:caspase family protein [bacterium]
MLKPETRIVDCSPITIVAKAVERKNGVGRITIELNGKIVFEGSNLSQKEHQLKVPITLNEKENKLTLLAHSTKRVKSYPQEISLTYKEELLRGKSLPELAKHYFGKSRSWAVVIGINSYSGKGSFGKLKYAVNDAAAVRKYLINHLDFSKEQIISIYDQQATRERIETLLGDELPGKLKQEDRLLVFFAGHGETRKSRKGEDCGYLVPVDGDKQRLEGTCISMDDLSRWSELIPARQILFIVDACYSGIAGLVHRKSKITEETRKQV